MLQLLTFTSLYVPGSATCVCHSKETIGGIFQGISDISNDETCTISILII